MIQVGEVLVSDDIKEVEFVCHLEKCKGACCVEGELGAPLEEAELETMKEIQTKIKPYLTKEGLAAIKEQGPYILDEDGDFKTLNDQRVLDKNDCGFNISWEDTTNGTVITRRWMIEDAYNGNVLEHTQQIQTTEFIPEANIKQTVPTARPNNSNADNKSDFVANFANELTDSL